MQRRNRHAGVEDRWRRSDGSPATRAGKGRRWLARSSKFSESQSVTVGGVISPSSDCQAERSPPPAARGGPFQRAHRVAIICPNAAPKSAAAPSGTGIWQRRAFSSSKLAIKRAVDVTAVINAAVSNLIGVDATMSEGEADDSET